VVGATRDGELMEAIGAAEARLSPQAIAVIEQAIPKGSAAGL
jgi:hypothetical protein